MKVIQFLLLFATTINLILSANIQPPRHPHDDVDNILVDIIDQAHVVNVESRLYGGVMQERGHSNSELRTRDRTELATNENDDVLEVIDGSKIDGSPVNIMADVLSKLDGFQYSSKRRNKWSKGTFTKALKELGVFQVKGLKVVKMKKKDINQMKGAKNRIKMVRAKKPRQHVQVKADQPLSKMEDIDKLDVSLNDGKRGVAISKRSGGYDLCNEYVDEMYVLAHDSSQLAYQVESVRCEGSCYSSTYGVSFGTCNLASKSMVVYVIDSGGNFVPQTISPGCACECLHYNQ